MDSPFAPPDQLARRLQRHVEFLALEAGPRHPLAYDRLERARGYLESQFEGMGYPLHFDEYPVEGRLVGNVIAEKPGTSPSPRVLVIGAHYDTVPGTPGADDNASGVACLLELARWLRRRPLQQSLRFAAFTLEEPPYFRTPQMGSLVHARRCRERGEVVQGMISLEMVGYYRQGKGSQRYPLPFMNWFYPDQGNFVAVAGNFRSRRLVRAVSRGLRESTSLAVESTAFPLVPGVGLSDNWAFWQMGYPALMITDTSFFRNPHYHLPSDLPDTLDYSLMAELVSGLAGMLHRLDRYWTGR